MLLLRLQGEAKKKEKDAAAKKKDDDRSEGATAITAAAAALSPAEDEASMDEYEPFDDYLEMVS